MWLARQIDFERSDVSPDGRLFGYYALNNEKKPSGGPHPGHYIALCRPPFFTALALWWTGGKQADRVIWRGPRQLAVGKNVRMEPDKGHLGDIRLCEPDEKEIWYPRYVWPYDERRLEAKVAKIQGNPFLKEVFVHRFPYFEWADVDHLGRLLLAREGRVFVHDGQQERELINLNLCEFCPLAPPDWATEWPT